MGAFILQTQDRPVVLGIDIGGTHFRIALMTEDMNLFCFRKERISEIYDPDQPIESLQSFISKYLAQNCFGTLKAIGIGFPSVISKDKMTLYSTPNLPGLDNINIVQALEDSFKVPIFINNDVNLHLNYEIHDKNLQEAGLIIGCYIGTGFGNSVYINGSFLDGKNGVAGELGHIPIFRNTNKCTCGNVGCVETIASGKRLVELHQQYFNNVPFEEIFSQYHEDPIIEEFIDCLSIPIATQINMLDPGYVILGGGVLQMQDFPKEKLERYIKQHTRKPYPEQSLRIQYAEGNQRTGILGAGYYVYNQLKEKGLKVHSN